MPALPSRPDVVVIGAGAAGIAAARELARRQVTCFVLEARDRIGGRAHTATIAGHRLDLGCEWLHSADRNVLARLAAEDGIGLDKSTPPWRKRNRQVGFDFADQDAFDVVSRAFFERLETAGAAVARGAPDGPASALLAPGDRWNGLLDAISTYYNGAPLDRVSILDFDRYADSEVNWRVEGGYGALIAGLSCDLPVKLGCTVDRVDARGRSLRVETSAGPIETDRLIVTVPTSVLASGAIRFDPPLDDHMAAAAGLPLGVADKVFFALAGADEFAPDTRLLGGFDRRDVGSYTLRPRGLPIVEGYFGGDHARRLEAGGTAAFAEAARQEISAALGRDLGARLTPLVATRWATDPLALGSYSHALPGHADARAQLAVPVQERIFFAGEATSPHFFSTAHGAWEEGERAAAAVAALFRPAVPAA